MSNTFIGIDVLEKLNREWSEFLCNIPDQLGYTIKEGNQIFDQKVNNWHKRMSLKYGVDMCKLKEMF